MSAALTTNVDRRLLRTTKFPPEFDVKVDMQKVNVPVIKTWIADEIARILNSDDDVVTELVFNIIESSRYPKIKELQISLTGFLDKDAPTFCRDLWKLCVDAQISEKGVPKELIEAKKQEIEQDRIEKDKAREAAMKRQEADREREREIDRIRERERDERRTRPRGGRIGNNYDRAPSRDSRSPPGRRRDREDRYRAPREKDSYVPSAGRSYRGREDKPRRTRPSPSYGSASPSRSPSPPPRRRCRNTSSTESLVSRSRTPPRKFRREPNGRPHSRDRFAQRRKERFSRDDSQHRHRSPAFRRRSPSPRRHHRRRSASKSDRSHSPPRKRNRRLSRSPSLSFTSPPPGKPKASKSRSRTPPSQRKNGTSLPPDDLMSHSDRRTDSYRRDDRRLSREPRDDKGPAPDKEVGEDSS